MTKCKMSQAMKTNGNSIILCEFSAVYKLTDRNVYTRDNHVCTIPDTKNQPCT